MKHISIIVLGLLLTACGQRRPSPTTSDADIQKRLVGTWTKAMNVDDEQFRTVVVYKPDGTYTGEGTIVQSNETRRFSESGTFLVKDGVMIETMTRHSSTNARVPQVQRMPIIRVDDRELVLRSEERPDLEPVTSLRQR